MFSELEEKTFLVVDKFLNELNTFNTEISFYTNGNSKEYFLAKELMLKYDLIKYRKPGSNTSIVDITQNGLTILKGGGIKVFLSKSAQKMEERENLEMQKLRGEIDDLTNRLMDYDNVKSRSVRSDRLAILAIILTAIGLLLQWLTYRNG